MAVELSVQSYYFAFLFVQVFLAVSLSAVSVCKNCEKTGVVGTPCTLHIVLFSVNSSVWHQKLLFKQLNLPFQVCLNPLNLFKCLVMLTIPSNHNQKIVSTALR